MKSKETTQQKVHQGTRVKPSGGKVSEPKDSALTQDHAKELIIKLFEGKDLVTQKDMIDEGLAYYYEHEGSTPKGFAIDIFKNAVEELINSGEMKPHLSLKGFYRIDKRERKENVSKGEGRTMRIPKIALDTNPGWVEYLKTRSEKMVGKTVKKVSCGMREHHNDLHQSQVLRLEFTDGSILHIETASNVQNIMQNIKSGKIPSINAPDFHADLWPTWEELNSDE